MSDKPLTTAAVQAHPLPDRFQAFYGQISGFDPMHRDAFLDVKVTAARDGYVLLSVALPEGLTRGFVAFLNAMQGLMRCADQQAVRAIRDARPVDLQEVEQAQHRVESFQAVICSRFDELRQQGTSPAAAVKAINAEMKAQGHPWAAHHLVRNVLSSAGKFRRNSQRSRRRW